MNCTARSPHWSARGSLQIGVRPSTPSARLRTSAPAWRALPANPRAIARPFRISTNLGTVEQSRIQSRLLWCKWSQAPAATPRRGRANPQRGVCESSRRGWGPAASAKKMACILLLATTTGYQTRSFGEAAERLGVELVFATDRCDVIDDPWRDGAIPIRFHDEPRSVAAILESARTRSIDGILVVGDRPTVIAARVAQALGLPGHPPEA